MTRPTTRAHPSPVMEKAAPPTRDRRDSRRKDPDCRPVMLQRWSSLLFLHWEVDPFDIQQTLPQGLHVDTRDGAGFIGIVPFRMSGVRHPKVPAFPWLSSFLELNVRTYVVDHEGRPGVWFYSLDCDRLPAVLAARSTFHLPYHWAKMALHHLPDGWTEFACVRQGRGRVARFRYRATPAPDAESPTQGTTAVPGSLEHFLIERYRLHAASATDSGHRLFEATVSHAPYRLRECELATWSRLPALWNELPLPHRPPDHQCMTDPVDVAVSRLRPLTD